MSAAAVASPVPTQQSSSGSDWHIVVESLTDGQISSGSIPISRSLAAKRSARSFS